MGHTFVPPHNLGDHLPTLITPQEKTLVTESFNKNQAMFRWYTAVDSTLKKQIIYTVDTVFLYPIKYQIAEFGQFTSLDMLNHILRFCG